MRPPVPPFTEETARQKVQAAEDAWNTRDPERVAGAYTEDSQWRNRDEFVTGRAEIVEFLTPQVGARARLRAAQGPVGVQRQPDRGALPVREPRRVGQWWRSYGNEQWEFDDEGYMRRRRRASTTSRSSESERRIFGPRPDSDHDKPIPLA